jgi:hypothetical protein
LVQRSRDTSVQLHPWNELYSVEHHGNEKPGSFISSVRIPAQQERLLRRGNVLPTCLLGKGFLHAEVAERPPQSPPSDAEVCFSVLSRKNEKKKEGHE